MDDNKTKIQKVNYVFIYYIFFCSCARAGEKKNLSFIPAELFCRIFFALLYFPPAASSSSTISPDNSYREKYDQKKKKMRGILYKKLNKIIIMLLKLFIKRVCIYIYVNVCESVYVFI